MINIKSMRTGFEDLRGGKNVEADRFGLVALPVIVMSIILGLTGFMVWAIAILAAAASIVILALIHGDKSLRNIVAMFLIACSVVAIVLGSTVIPNGYTAANAETIIEEGVVEAENGDALPAEVELKPYDVTYQVKSDDFEVNVAYGEMYSETTELNSEKVEDGWEATQTMLQGAKVALNASVASNKSITCIVRVNEEVVEEKSGKGKATCQYILPNS